MSGNNTLEKMVEEIELFIPYAVPEQDIGPARALVHRYRNNRFVLRVLREYYSALPDAREERVVKIARLLSRQGISLVVVSTPMASYLYAVSIDQVLLVGEYRREVDSELLAFFGFAGQEAFLQACLPPEQLDECSEADREKKPTCPACGVREGEYHLLGCSVEICPWCDGQLSRCNCRYEKLETDNITDEEQLEAFFELLTDKGRIPFRKSHAPAYPGTSRGLDRGSKVAKK